MEKYINMLAVINYLYKNNFVDTVENISTELGYDIKFTKILCQDMEEKEMIFQDKNNRYYLPDSQIVFIKKINKQYG